MNIKERCATLSGLVPFCVILSISSEVQSLSSEHYKTYRIGSLSCSFCPPGTYLGKDCTSSTPTTCYPCPEGYYTEEYNRYSSCSRCSHRRLLHGHVIQKCTPITNQKWECDEGYYSVGDGQPCKPQKYCEVGDGAVKPGTPYQTAQCKTCPNGTYSDVRSYTQKCHLFSRCENYGSNVQEIKAGNSTHKNQCGCLPCERKQTFTAAFYAILGCLVFLAVLLVVSNALWVYFILRRQRPKAEWQPEHDVKLSASPSRDNMANGKANRTSDTSMPLLNTTQGCAQDDAEASLLQNSSAVPDNDFLWQLSGDIGHEYETLAIILQVPKATVQQIQMSKQGGGNIRYCIFETLQYWRDKCQTTPKGSCDRYDMLASALGKLEMNDLAELVRDKSKEDTEVSV